jgi:hypothetical protein
MLTRVICNFFATAALATSLVACTQGGDGNSGWQMSFDTDKCTLKTVGRSTYYVLEPGFQKILQGGDTKLQITVLNETKKVGGVETRVVEEREWKNGELYEVARNYFAFCEQTKDVFYFGEDVDFYKNGKIVKHDGTWHAGVNGNKPGLIMPGNPKVGMKHFQEVAPAIAMDRAEIISMDESCKTPAGTFAKCMKVKETSAIEFTLTEYKYHAPDIGLIRDADLVLISYGFVKP